MRFCNVNIIHRRIIPLIVNYSKSSVLPRTQTEHHYPCKYHRSMLLGTQSGTVLPAAVFGRADGQHTNAAMQYKT